MKQMWLIFKDNKNMLFEIIGQSNDDTNFNKDVVSIQNNGYSVSCTSEYINNSTKEYIIEIFQNMGFTYSKNLFENMKNISKKRTKMNTWDFNNCKSFLEYMIQEKENNSDLIKAYEKLIEETTKYDIAISSHNAEVQKNWENSQKEITTNFQTNQADVTKESIKQGFNSIN